jgi:hypothetical protein
MLGGVFHLSGRQLIIVSFTATLLLFSLVANADLVFSYGPERFYTAALLPGDFDLGLFAIERETLIYGLLPLAAWFLTLYRLLRASGPSSIAPLFFGVALTISAALVALVYKAQLDVFHRLARVLFAWTPQGYFDPARDYQYLHPGHLTAAAVFLVCVLAYFGAGYITGRTIKLQPKSLSSELKELPVPTLAWILMLLVIGAWLLPFLAFFSDCFPYSVAVNLVLVLTVIGKSVSRFLTDPHTYRAFPRQHREPAPTPAEILARMPRGKAVIVCASGGGIHAGAWAAALLDHLSDRIPAFRQHVALTSSVSGGSVGCYYFLASYGLSTTPAVFPMAAASSLDYAAWGYAFGDLVRYFFPLGPVFRWGNRSWAIESAWRRFRDWDQPGTKPLHAKLESWQRDATDGLRPAAVFNTTIVETGERFPISTVALEANPKSFLKTYPNFTLRAATAANLSAAFPFVSPAASIWVHPEDSTENPGPAYHLVDGGYYDNYGVLSALEFIDSAFATLGPQSPDVLILRIEGHNDAGAGPKQKPGFLFQVSAPLKTMFSMRSASQRSRNRFDLDLIQARWSAAWPGRSPIRELVLAYPNPGAPLTWHLTAEQKSEIGAAIQSPPVQTLLAQVDAFLA